ncbi:MAG TPA: hypothetical protein ENN18_05695 [Proteobacteria bacterium]|nr:hypothetical protein [Pseudomonadota bacterium]
MSNHVHILLFSGHQGISSFMRRLLTGYAVNYNRNRRHHRTGHLFQNRYKSIVCDEDAYLLKVVQSKSAGRLVCVRTHRQAYRNPSPPAESPPVSTSWGYL